MPIHQGYADQKSKELYRIPFSPWLYQTIELEVQENWNEMKLFPGKKNNEELNKFRITKVHGKQLPK